MPNVVDENDGFDNILIVLDVFSKFAWAKPIVGAKAHDVSLAFQEILDESGRKPDRLWTDEGKEFMGDFTKMLDENGIEIYQTKTKEKASVAERFIRTLKERIWKYFTARNTERWINVLQPIVDDYNRTKHSSIGMTPRAASNESRENEVFANLYPDELLKKAWAKFKVGDPVRLMKYKRMGYAKGFTPNWSRRIFVVSEVKRTKPVTYEVEKLKLNREEVKKTQTLPEQLRKANKRKPKRDQLKEKDLQKLIETEVRAVKVIDGTFYEEEMQLAQQKQWMKKSEEKKEKIKRPIKFRDLDSSAVDTDWEQTE